MSNFLSDSFDNGFRDAFLTIEKVAGEDVAGALYEHMTKEAGPKMDAVKGAYKSTKEYLGGKAKGVGDYAKGQHGKMKQDYNTAMGNASGRMGLPRTTDPKERIKAGIRAAARGGAMYGAPAAAAGYGGYKAMRD